MTDKVEKLIAEARLAACSECSEEGTSPAMRCDGDLIRRLADALEALLALHDLSERTIVRLVDERDALAAQIAAAKALIERESWHGSGEEVGTDERMVDADYLDDILSADPAEWLREHDAKVWDEGQKSGLRYTDRMRAAYEMGRPELPGPASANPYRKADDV